MLAGLVYLDANNLYVNQPQLASYPLALYQPVPEGKTCLQNMLAWVYKPVTNTTVIHKLLLVYLYT